MAGEIEEPLASRLDRQKNWLSNCFRKQQEAASAISAAVDGLPPDLARYMVDALAAQSVRDEVTLAMADNSNGVYVSPPSGDAQTHD